MEITKRPSGGRGEYEVAGKHGSIQPQDLLDKELRLELGRPFPDLHTGITVRSQGGKLRLRRLSNRTIHIHRQLEVVTLLPKSIRDEAELPGGEPVLFQNRFILRSIRLGRVRLAATAATIRAGRIDCDNGSTTAYEIDCQDRIQRIRAVHEAISRLPTIVRELIDQHRKSLMAGSALTRESENLLEELMHAVERSAADYDIEYIFGTDVLPALEAMVQPPLIEVKTLPQVEEIEPENIELRRREISQWQRWAAARGAPAARFRRTVRTAYRSTCIVCGITLPSGGDCRVPGVDAAHILPWAVYDLDLVSNGLCLCKLHHWAFDQQLIALIPVPAGGYEVVVTALTAATYKAVPATLAALRAVSGPVARDRLPDDPHDWPSTTFLQKLYETARLDEIG